MSSANSGWSHSEYMADADPDHPDRLLVCAMPYDEGRNTRRTAVYSSFDNGRTWTYTQGDSGSRPGLSSADPACAYGLNGIALFTALRQDSVELDEADAGTREGWSRWPLMQLYRSTDGGRTWAAPTRLGLLDHENLLVDRTRGPYHGRIYLHGNNADWHDPKHRKLWLLYSTDGGRTFTQSAATAVADDWRQFDLGVVLPDGAVLIPYIATDTTQRMSVAVAASTDGGEHLSTPVPVAPPSEACSDAFSTPQMAADHSTGPFRGRAFVVWSTYRREGEEVAAHCVVTASHSDDRGRTWSAPVQVSDGPLWDRTRAGPDTRLPAVAVNDRGVVGVTWYDRREDPRNRSGRLRFTASSDGGETWLPSVPVGTKSYAHEGVRGLPVEVWAWGGVVRGVVAANVFRTVVVPGSRQFAIGGDYSTLVADARGVFHAFWVDNRDRVQQRAQLYTAPVAVRGSAVRRAAELAELENVTPRLELRYHTAKSSWTPDAVSLALKYVLVNRSVDTIQGPLKLRITRLQSPLGTAAVLLKNGQAGGVGTVLDLSDALPQGTLVPGGMTSPQSLRVRIAPLEPTVLELPEVVGFDGQVFGVVRSTEPHRAVVSTRSKPRGSYRL